MNLIIIQTMKKLLNLSLTLVVLAIFAEISVAQTPACDIDVTEGDLLPGGIASFVVTNGPGSVTVDHVNAGSGLQMLTVVGVPENVLVNIPLLPPGGTFSPVVVTYTPIDPLLPVHFKLRAASIFHAIFIRVWCGNCIPPPSNMRAWYPFDESVIQPPLTITQEITPFNNDGTYFPAGPTGPTRIVPGKVSNALRFDGINDYVQAPSIPAINFGTAGFPIGCNAACRGDFSIDAWIRLSPTDRKSVV